MDREQLIREFASPSVAWRGKPFWSWNGELRAKDAVRQAHIMKEMGLGGYFMHSRAGLITEYLGDEWFDIINDVADAAEADGMEAWLYDEDRWPSGSAGGKVTVDPRYRMKSLVVYEMPPELYAPKEDTCALYIARMKGIDLYAYEEMEDLSAQSVLSAVESFASGEGEVRVLRFAIVPDQPDSSYNGGTYIDTMSRQAVDRFIQLTHEAYAARCGDRLGRSIKGIFTDEPHRGHCMDDRKEEDGVVSCSMCWTDDIFDEFKKRYGYDARPILPELFYRLNGNPVAPVKLHYIDLADNLFIERFADPINQWCVSHGMIFTGHVLHEDSLMNQTVPNGSLMRFYGHMGIPGVDCLTEWNDNWHIVKQLASAARQNGQKWLLSELYGCTGWQFNLKSHKTVGDWQALLGINVRCQHLSWYTMEGESKRDYPASILHQSPWYRNYAKVEDYFARFGLMMSLGEPDCDLLVLNPVESLWCRAYAGWARWIENTDPEIECTEKAYKRLCDDLLRRQIDFDYGEEQMLSQMACVERDAEGLPVLRVGKALYRAVLVSGMITLRKTTLRLLEAFRDAGGRVIFAGEPPAYVDALPSDAPRNLAQRCACVSDQGDAIASAVRENTRAYVSVDSRDVFARVRKTADGFVCIALNTDRDHPRKGMTLSLRTSEEKRLQEWNLETGERRDASALARYEDGSARIALDLEAAGTRCFVLTDAEESLRPVESPESLGAFTLTGECAYTRDEPNVCVLDRVRWRAEDGPWSEPVEALKADRAVRDLYGLEHRGGDMLQPWFAKRFDRKVYGRIRLEYAFEIESLPRGDVYLAGERPERNHYAINGVPLENTDIDDFWVDDCFKRMRIPKEALRPGRNTVTACTMFTRTSNIEAIYLLGDFGVRAGEKINALIDLPQTIGCGDLAQYAMPFYTGRITYRLKPGTPAPYPERIPADADRIMLVPKGFTGGCAEVNACGKGTQLLWDPYEADVTEAVRAGRDIEITVVGTRRNVFGPLHELPAIGRACGPWDFVTEGEHWTDGYSLIGSGLKGFEFRAYRVK